MEALLEKFIGHIEALQSKGDAYFPKGLLPAVRKNPSIGYFRPDTTVFFSAISAFTLQKIGVQVGGVLQKKINQICDGVIQNYPVFQNKDGLATYNFWRTKPSDHFSNGYVFHKFEHFRIPDDVDDTAFVYLTTSPTEQEVHWLKEKLTLHANGTKQWIQNTYPEYKKLKAYSTWFGKNMYIEFDVCVLSNLMLLVYQYQLPLNRHDHHSLEYIHSVIKTKRYITAPFRCAHQYPRTALIIYHVARLIGDYDPDRLRDIKDQLIQETWDILQRTAHPMDRLILSTSLLRLGVQPTRIDVAQYKAADFEGFYFFIAGLLTAYENPILYKLSILPLFHMRWVCEAHCWTLLAEYTCLQDAADRLEKHS
jgi:hypothetical protein